MATGTVKWFNDAKGYGFLSQDGGKDVFFHRNSVEGEGIKSLPEGTAVEFEAREGPKGLEATTVVVTKTQT